MLKRDRALGIVGEFDACQHLGLGRVQFQSRRISRDGWARAWFHQCKGAERLRRGRAVVDVDDDFSPPLVEELQRVVAADDLGDLE